MKDTRPTLQELMDQQPLKNSVRNIINQRECIATMPLWVFFEKNPPEEEVVRKIVQCHRPQAPLKNYRDLACVVHLMLESPEEREGGQRILDILAGVVCED